MFAAAGLGCGCEISSGWHLTVTVTIPPNVQASYADSLPAGVFIAGQKLDDGDRSALGSTFAPRTLGLVCEPGNRSTSFRTTVNELGCGVETRVHAWLHSETGLRDFLASSPAAATTTPEGFCEKIEPIDTDTIYPSAAPSPTAPQAERIAFSGQHPGDCDREQDSVNLVLDTPRE
jgi:hypothetical protein